MNILILGSGAREHALAKAFKRSQHEPVLYCCGTSLNPGIKALTEAYWVGDITNKAEVAAQAKKWAISMAIIGPEAPLEQGLADVLKSMGLAVIGPEKDLAQIETSKTFTRHLMERNGIAGLPRYKAFSKMEGIEAFLDELGQHYVIKADGLMAGKGVKLSGEHLHNTQEALAYCAALFAQGQGLVIEEQLRGPEFSLMCFSDGKTLLPMPLVQDNKRAFVHDKGPNTGGMGSYSAPDHRLPFLSQNEIDSALSIVQAVWKALMNEIKKPYIGILYGGFMLTASGVYVIEFNARFGDPESLNVLSLLESDFVDLCLALTQGYLDQFPICFAPQATVCKYAVPEGYPDKPLRDVVIDVSEVEDPEGLYLAAVHEQDGQLYATGSRTAAYVGVAPRLSQAEQLAEQEIARIKGPLFHREDIGTPTLIERSMRLQSLES